MYNRLTRLELKEEGLRRCSYPRPHSSPGRAKIYPSNLSFLTTIPGPLTRTCRRCKTLYNIQADGSQVTVGKCDHHWGKLSRTTRPIYHCCKRPLGSQPCATAPLHVSDEIDPDNLTGFINTGINSSVTTESIYALDCEMLYTTAGMDVAAISIVDHNCNLVYETLILPDAPIIDYNTDHSGLTKEQFRGVTTTLKDVHSKLLSLVGSRTILVGHGLNHDLLRLKVIHDRIVDTSVVYPHPKGPRIRNSLAFLKDRFLSACSSSSKVLKCRDDAKATMQLVLRKC